MSRQNHDLYISDLSTFTKSLRKHLLANDEIPSHAALLGQIAKSAGFGNFQHYKALSSVVPASSPLVAKALRVFDEDARMQRWPAKTQLQALCLWVFWAQIPPQLDHTEQTINDILRPGQLFGDHVLMRRSLIDHKLVTRSRDGRIYRRIEQRPPEDALALIAAVRKTA